MYTKLQGVREYLDQTGVTLPEPEEAPAEAVESEVAEKESLLVFFVISILLINK